jgi:hypothetical protein
MKLFLRRNAPLFYALAAMLALYIPWLNRGYLNWEWPHVLAGEALAYPEKIGLLDAYWSTGQANPLGYPLFNALLQRLVPWTDAPWLWRVPSLVGCGLIVTWGWLVRDEFGKNSLVGFCTWTTLLVTSPMIFAFSTHASSDVLPVGILLISFWFLNKFAKSGNFNQLLVSAVLFGLSSTVRYIAPYLVGYVIFVVLRIDACWKKRLLSFLTFGMLSGAVLIAEIAWKVSRFDVLVSTRLSQNGPNFLDFSSWFLVALKYLSFIGMFFGFLPVFAMFKKAKHIDFQLRHVFVVAVSILLAIASTVPVKVGLARGELNFGGGFVISEQVFNFAIFGGFLNVCILIFVVVDRKSSWTEFETVWFPSLIAFLVLISASRPSQRYLIYLIPVVLVFLVRKLFAASIYARRTAVLLSCILFILVSLWGMSYLTSQGNASEEMAVWVEENSLISRTSAGAIRPHAGQHWWGIAPDETRYEIIAVKPSAEAQVKERILHREPMKVLGKVTRVYLLREIPVSP